jgi:hypothetical protein
MSNIIEAHHLTLTNPGKVFILPKKKNTFEVDNKTKLAKVCAFCNKIETAQDSFKTCSACKISIYCSKDCQKKHWKIEHKNNCGSSRGYDNSNQKHCSRILQASLIYHYELYVKFPNEYTQHGYNIMFNDSNDIWYVQDCDEEFFLLTKSDEKHFKVMCEKYKWNHSHIYWKTYYGECIFGKLFINKH